MKILSDTDAERGLLAGLIKGGSISYHEIGDIGLTDASFTIDSHSVLFKCLDYIFKNQDDVYPDIPLIYSASSDLGLRSWLTKNEEVQYLNSIATFPVQIENIRTFGLKVKKLEIGRLMIERLKQAEYDTYEISGTESINDIFGIVEKTLLDCGAFLSSKEKCATKLGDGMREYFDDLEKNPIENVGISTGMPIYDRSIGGGLRNGSVDVVAARMGVGKSSLSMNIALHVSQLGFPVLILDSEMGIENSWARSGACISEIDNRLIETGQYIKFNNDIVKVKKTISKIENLPIYFESIAGLNLENQISVMKRWLITNVGIKKNGLANQCLIIYDYLKLMDQNQGGGYQEYQMIGFLITSLVNFAQKYKVPIFSLVQTNRDGISKEDSSVIAQSDRIGWFASSLSLFKIKDINETNQDGIENGNRKMIIIKSRFGPGLSPGDYINLNFNGSISKITEGKTKSELFKENKKKKIMEESLQNDGDEPISF